MKKLLLILTLFPFLAYAGRLDGVKICINPGHGGHDSNDRFIAETGFWESDGNLTKGLALRDILEAEGATIIMTRTQNRTEDDLPLNSGSNPSLTSIVSIANNNHVDYMHAIHSNGYNGQLNYTLLLFQGGDDTPTYAGSKVMSTYLADEINAANRTTGKYVRGDFDFYGTGQAYLGVFKGLTMAASLSEGSFHDYVPESWRLMNLDYRRNEARAIARGFFSYFEASPFDSATVAGRVLDNNRSVTYFANSLDTKLPVNHVTVTLEPGHLVYTGDGNHNGFYVFPSVAPGSYMLYVEAPFYKPDSFSITVSGGITNFHDFKLEDDGTLPPSTPASAYQIIGSDGSVGIQCSATENANSYRACIYDESMTAVDTLSSDSTLITFTPESGKVY